MTTRALGLHLYCVIFLLLSCDPVILSVVRRLTVHSQTFGTGIVTTIYDYYRCVIVTGIVTVLFRIIEFSTSDNTLFNFNVSKSLLCYS